MEDRANDCTRHRSLYFRDNGAASDTDRLAMEHHIVRCLDCSGYVAELAALRPERLTIQHLFIRAVATEPPNHEVATQALRAIRESRLVRPPS